MNLNLNELLYFKHKCIHDVKFEFTWNNINKVKYSPPNDPKGRSAMNPELLIPSPTGSTYFELNGSPKEKCRMELDKVKSIISSIKRGDFASLIPIAHVSEGMSSSSESRPLPAPVANSSSILSTDRRQLILSNNEFIRKQYEELVVKSKLLDEEDFWLSYNNQSEDFFQDKQTKGKLTTHFSESIQVHESEWKSVPEAKKRNIFRVYPAIRKAYDLKEELNVSEEDFWRRYTYSFRHDSDGIDELFVRAVLNSDESLPQAQIKSIDLEKNRDIDVDVDLRNIHDDFYTHSTESINQEYQDSQFKESEKIRTKRLLTGGWNEYNQQSKLLLESSSLSTASIKKLKTTYDRIEELGELQFDTKSNFVPLNVAKEQYNSSTTAPASDEKDEDNDDSSAFGKATNIVVRNFRNNSKTAEILTKDGILATMGSVWPNTEQAEKYLKKEVIQLHSLTASASQAANQGGSLVHQIGGEEGTKTIVDGHELSDEFKQEMGEIFVSITERMRHFYALLNRDGSGAPVPGSSGERKVNAIIEDLERIGEKLGSKKTKLQDTYAKGTRDFMPR